MKKMVALLVVIFVLVTVPAQQKIKRGYYKKYQDALALYSLDEPTAATDSTAIGLFLEAATEANAEDDTLAVHSLINAGNIYQGFQRFEEANLLYYRAIQLNRQSGENPFLYYEAYLYLGSSHYFNSIIDSAQLYFEAASRIEAAHSGNNKLPDRETLYNSLGSIYYESANYMQAKNYFGKALDFTSPESGDYDEMFTGIQSNIANCLMKLNRYDSALGIFLQLKPTESYKELIRQNTAYTYFELGQYDSALNIYQSLDLKSGYSSVAALTAMGRIYMNRKQWQQAEIVFDSAISRNKKISGNVKNREEARAYLYRSILAKEQGFTDEAATWINEALKEVHLSFTWKRPEDLPADVSNTVSPVTLFSILYEKAGLMYKKYSQTLQPQWLKASLAAYRKAIETADFIKVNFDNDEAKLFFNTTYRAIYSDALQVAYEAVESDSKAVDDYIFVLENYKGNILYQNLRNIILKSAADIPDSIRYREKEIKQQLAFYISRINQTTGEKDAQLVQKKLLTLKVELSRLQKNYEQYTGYNPAKGQYTGEKQTLQTIQKAMNANTAIFNYYQSGDSLIFCIAISKDKFRLYRIVTDSLFNSNFQSFIGNVYRHEEGERYEGHSVSNRLYRQLIKPVAEMAADNWVIIPDGKLHYLPFDALSAGEKTKEYLVLSKTISYHYSFALLFGDNNHHKAAADRKNVLGFVPYNQSDFVIEKSNMPPLPFSADEIRETEGSLVAGVKATKKQFLTDAPGHSFIHLATHASTGSDSINNWIQFYPEDSMDMNNKLFLPEIYNLDLHRVELVVLSACETGGGANTSGEGLLSLSRAFMYAGADGVISTLWKTEDKVTAFLMKKMYSYLSDNYPAEKALQLAKKALLADKTIPVKYKSPNYWANFIYNGKLMSDAGRSAGGKWIWLILIPAVLAAGAGLIVLQKRKPRL
jgi:CHAT domain-containing protein/tetratricopeptide (TPR) repeat protein